MLYIIILCLFYLLQFAQQHSFTLYLSSYFHFFHNDNFRFIERLYSCGTMMFVFFSIFLVGINTALFFLYLSPFFLAASYLTGIFVFATSFARTMCLLCFYFFSSLTSCLIAHYFFLISQYLWPASENMLRHFLPLLYCALFALVY